MWMQVLLGAVGVGAVLGAVGTTKVNKLTNKVVNKVKPKKNKVAILEVELEEGQSISDLAFLVVKGVSPNKSKDVVETIVVDYEELANEA